MRLRVFMAALLVILLAGCGAGGSDQIKVAVSNTILEDAVQMVGGTHVQITTIMKAGVDPHHFTPKPGDVPDDTQLLFSVSVDALILKPANTKLIQLTDAIPGDKFISTPDGLADSHFWMDVSLWELVVGKIRDELSAADAAHAEDYKNNAEAYLVKLRELDDYVRGQIDRIPAEQRLLITAHDGFSYFGRTYGMDVLAIQDANADPASADSIQTILQTVIQKGVPAIFAESTLPQDAITTIINEATAQGLTIENGGLLYSDSLGAQGSDVSTYDGMMRHNADTIVTALLNLPAE